MKSITKLKDEARKHEQREEWEKAIRAYLQVLEAGDDESGEVELPLFNRVGDLYVRLGRSKDAVHYYEQAADRYAEAGLYNNAIALCNKAARYSPGNMELVRKLGQFSAQQGFLTDARRYYLEYAEKKIAAGETDAAFRALSSFADASDDAEVRELLGRRLHVHGRTSDAVHELRRAYDMRVDAGENAAAETLRAEILAIDPHALPEPPVAAGPTPPPSTKPEPPPAPAPFEEESFGSFEAPAADVATPGAEEEYRIDLPGLDTGIEAETDAETTRLEGLESGVFEGFEEAAGGELLAGLEAAPEFEAPAELSPVELEGLDRPVLDAPLDVPHLDTSAFEESTGSWDEDVAFDLPTLDTDYEADEPPPSFDLPLLTEDADEEAEPADAVSLVEPLPTLEEAVAELEAETDEAAAALPELPPLPELEEAVEQLEAPSSWESGLELPSFDTHPPEPAAPEAVEAVGGFEDEVEAGEELPAAGGEVEERHFRFAAADAAAEVEAPAPEREDAETAGDEPVEAGEEELGWDPTDLGPAAPAYESAAAAPPTARGTPPAERARSAGDDFIDLGSLLAEDDEPVRDTRFVVQEKAPTGDEDQDFAELLAQFKQKVAENVSTEDAAAHYDLGLAFKEMGLVDEAIGEFQIALRAGDMRLRVYEELGQCFLLKEQYNIAEKVLRRALETRYEDELELLGVYYHLGRAYEAMDKREQARDAYERVLGLDINFGDVSARLARL